MGFRNAITAGVTLIREAIQSQNFESGSAGWRIKADGDAEFNSVVIRGGTVVGGLALYYNGTPGAGTLIMSIAATAGTDPYGNAYVAGVGVYGTTQTVTVQDTAGSTARLRLDAPSYVGDSTAPGLELKQPGDGDGASYTAYDDTFDHGALLLSPSPVAGGVGGEDFAYVQMVGRFSADPSIQLVANGPNSFVSVNQTVFDPNGQVISYAGGNGATPFTPVLNNGGAATYTASDAWYYRVGDMIFVNLVIVIGTAGSGGSIVTVDMPTGVDRTTRQTITSHYDGVTSTRRGSGETLFFTVGSGATADRMRTFDNQNLLGSDLLAGSVLTVQGWYREGV